MKATSDRSAISAGELAEELLANSLIDPVIEVMGREGRESPILEFKGVYESREQLEVVRWHVARAVIAMANADGGCIIIGIDDGGAAPVPWRPELAVENPEDKDYFDHARNFIFKETYRDENGATISIPPVAVQKLKRESVVKFHICKSRRIAGHDFLVLVVNPVKDSIFCKCTRNKFIKGKKGESDIIKEIPDSVLYHRSSESARTMSLSSCDAEFDEKYNEFKSRDQKKAAYFNLLQEFYGKDTPEEDDDDLSFLDDILERHIEISYHAFVGTNPSDEDKANYLSAFALVFAAIGGFADIPYWASLARRFQCEGLTETVRRLAETPEQINISAIRQTLSSDERRYAWCLDAMMLGLEDGTVNEKVAQVIVKLGKVLGYHVNELRPFLKQVAQLMTSNEPKALFDAIREIRHRTSAWKTVMDYRRISLKGAFEDITSKLEEAYATGNKLYFEIVQAELEISSASLSISMMSLDSMQADIEKTLSLLTDLQETENLGENGIVPDADGTDRPSSNDGLSTDDDLFTPEQRTETIRFRRGALARFKDIKQRMAQHAENASSAVSDANEILWAFGTNGISFSDDLYQIEPDEVIGAGNEHWDDNMEKAYNRLTENLERANTALEDLLAQISLYENGKYEESAVENKQKAEEERRRKLATEKESKKKTRIDVEGVPCEVTFDTRKIESPPFYVDDLQKLSFFAGHWFAIADNKVWRSEDAVSWHEVPVPVETTYGTKLKAVGSTFILWDEYNLEFCFTTDGTAWTKSRFPGEEHGFGEWNIDLLHFHGRWLLLRKHLDDYTYMEIGEMADKRESSSANTSHFFEAETLSSGWTEREDLKMHTGDYILDATLFSIGDTLAAVRGEDSAMLSNRHAPDNGPRFVFAREGKGWSTVYADDDVNKAIGASPQIFPTPYGPLCAGDGLCTTADGRSWRVVAKSDIPRTILVVGDLVVGVNWNRLSLSADARSFADLRAEHNLNVVATNGEVVLFADQDQQTGGLFIGKFVRKPLRPQ